MMENASPFFPALFWALFGLVVFYNALVLYLFSNLKRAHQTVWIELGSPSFFNNSIANNWKFFGFLFGQKRLSFSDRKVDRLIWIIRALFAASAIMFLGLIFNIFHL
jgi:hypothetical protein